MNIIEKMNALMEKENDLQKNKEQILSEQKKALRKEQDAVEKEFIQYIKNKDISVCERWQVFIQANDEYKRHFHSIPKNLGEEIDSMIESISDGYNEYNIGDTIYIKNILSHYYSEKNKLFYIQEYEDCDLEPATNYNKEEIENLRLFQLFEEILQANLGSFSYSW